jgi:hypothetical protein
VEENMIEDKAIKTGFEAHSAETSVRVIRAHSTAKFILSAHFKAIKSELNLNKKPEDQILLKTFYDKFSSTQESDRAQVLAAYSRLSQADLSKETLIREEDLTIVAILLSRSSAEDKAKALYDVFDDGLTGNLTKPAVNEIFKVALELAISDLPVLTKSQSDEVKNYLAKAVQNFSLALAAAVKLAVTNQSAPAVAKNDFVAAVIKYKEGALTTVAGLREFSFEQTKPVPSSPPQGSAPTNQATAPQEEVKQ